MTTRLRNWTPALSMTLVSLISYIDRNTLALLAPTLLSELRLSGEQYGWVVSGFSVAYMLSNVLWGRWIDQFGLRLAMTAAVLFWSAASASHALAVGLVSLFAARTALGFGEGATFPGGLRTVVQTLPPSQRARGVALAYSGGSLGAVVTPLVVMPVFAVYGWRGAFYFTGMVGLAWVVLWQWISRRKELATVGREATAVRPRWGDPRLWSFLFIYAFGALPLGFVLYYAALYLKVLGKTQVEIGQLLWIPPLGWEAGYFFWGWWTDRSMARCAEPVRALRGVLGLLMVLSFPLALAPLIESVALVMALLFFAMFVTAGFIIGGVSYATTVFGERDSGFLAGLGAGSWSVLVAVVMPLAGKLFDQQQYATAFLLASIFPLLGFIGWMVLEPGERAEGR